MKGLSYLLGLFVLGSAFAGCAEDDITPNPLEKDYFLEPEGASGFELQLQREFFEQEGSYVLFNDTLSSEYLGDNANGEPVYFYQTLNLGYRLVSSSDGSSQEHFSFDYFTTDDEKQAAVDFLSENILPSLGASMRPYSFLLVNGMEYYEPYYGDLALVADAVVYSGWNCTVIAMQGVDNMSVAEQEAFRLNLLQSMANNKMQLLDESVFDEFYAFCESYYSTYFMNEEAEAFCQQYPTQHDVGFLSTYAYGWNGFLWIANFKAKEYDLEDYTNAVFSIPEDEFMTTYADYPIVQEKYRILKGIIEDLGIIF